MKKEKKLFKEYPREYECVFTDKKRNDARLKLDNVTTYNDDPKNVLLYKKLFRDEIDKWQDNFFDSALKILWLKKRFEYFGRRNGISRDIAFGIFGSLYLNFNVRAISLEATTRVIESYVNDFFVDFGIHSPFDHNYKYPYKYMNFSCIALVKQLPMRMDLLSIGENKKMKYVDFLDYVLNYIKCFNDENNTKYDLFFPQMFGYRYIKNYGAKKTKARRVHTRRKNKI